MENKDNIINNYLIKNHLNVENSKKIELINLLFDLQRYNNNKENIKFALKLNKYSCEEEIIILNFEETLNKIIENINFEKLGSKRLLNYFILIFNFGNDNLRKKEIEKIFLIKKHSFFHNDSHYLTLLFDFQINISKIIENNKEEKIFNILNHIKNLSSDFNKTIEFRKNQFKILLDYMQIYEEKNFIKNNLNQLDNISIKSKKINKL